MHKLYTDGGSRGNPGPAATGCFLYDEDEFLVDFSGSYLGENTNNYAEYKALIEGIKLAKKNRILKLMCYLDSELVEKQLNGAYKVKKQELRVLYDEAMKLKEKFQEIYFVHIKREDNRFADKMVNTILDGIIN